MNAFPRTTTGSAGGDTGAQREYFRKAFLRWRETKNSLGRPLDDGLDACTEGSGNASPARRAAEIDMPEVQRPWPGQVY